MLFVLVVVMMTGGTGEVLTIFRKLAPLLSRVFPERAAQTGRSRNGFMTEVRDENSDILNVSQCCCSHPSPSMLRYNISFSNGPVISKLGKRHARDSLLSVFVLLFLFDRKPEEHKENSRVLWPRSLHWSGSINTWAYDVFSATSGLETYPNLTAVATHTN